MTEADRRRAAGKEQGQAPRPEQWLNARAIRPSQTERLQYVFPLAQSSQMRIFTINPAMQLGRLMTMTSESRLKQIIISGGIRGTKVYRCHLS